MSPTSPTTNKLKRHVCRTMTDEGRSALSFHVFGDVSHERSTVWGPVLQDGQLVLQKQDDTGEVTSEVITLSMAVEVLGGFDAIDWDALDAAEAALKQLDD